MATEPTLDLERELFATGTRFVIGCDEVGRGAIAGPVAVGMCAIDSAVGPMPAGLRDSKLLTERRRDVMAPLAASWVNYSAVGLASAAEVDQLGITASLGLAGQRALGALEDAFEGAGVEVEGSIILLDGLHNWLSPALRMPVEVRTRAKADRDCACVAAASVIAKVHRDALMIAADASEPGYGWRRNKGYGSAGHFAAIEQLGASSLHRLSWLRPPAVDPQTA